jgi:hypothetical protein
VKIMSSRTTVPPDIFSRDLHEPSVDLGMTEEVNGLPLDPPPKAEAPSTGANVMQMEGSPPPADLELDWRISYHDCLIRGELPSNKTKARRITRWAKTFMIYGNDKELYQRSPTGNLQRCITVEEGRKLLSDLHSGGLRSSRGASNPRRKRVSVGFLLADRGLRRHQASMLLQRVLVLRKANPSPGSCPANHPYHMVIRCLGARLGWTPEENNQGLHPLARRCRQIF